jgi:hypothetical protein
MIRRGWMRFVHAIGRAQTSLLLTLVYLLGIGPLWLFVTVIGRNDLLGVRRRPATSFSAEKPKIPTDRERCERQF